MERRTAISCCLAFERTIKSPARLAHARSRTTHTDAIRIGRRKVRLVNSPNTAWRVEAFNAYADHMRSSEFQASWRELVELASNHRTAIMCAEALPWQCHRRLLADAFVAHGWTVFDIMPAGKTVDHKLPPFARVAGSEVTYPGEVLF